MKVQDRREWRSESDISLLSRTNDNYLMPADDLPVACSVELFYTGNLLVT